MENHFIFIWGDFGALYKGLTPRKGGWYHVVACIYESDDGVAAWYRRCCVSGRGHTRKKNEPVRRCHPLCKAKSTHKVQRSAAHMVFRQDTARSLCILPNTPHGASCLDHAMSAWSI